jgi:murein DD-endopeptidase MepM/ murein hydrolase activator NlpD
MSNLNFPAKFKSQTIRYTLQTTEVTSETPQKKPITSKPHPGVVKISARKLTREIFPIVQKVYLSSFSLLKRNFFKFGLEVSLIALTLASVGINVFHDPINYSPNEHAFLDYLVKHPGLNEKIIAQLNTENIRVRPERANFILSAQASTIEGLVSIPAVSSPNDTGTTENNLSSLSSDDGTLHKPNYATLDSVHRTEITEYTVKSGDSIAKIASDFDVSIYTILQENALRETEYIRPGQVLRILPTTGLKHTVKSGETMSAIAKKYNVDLESILAFNAIEIPEDILPGETLIIPDGRVELPKISPSIIASYSRTDYQTASTPSDFSAASGGLIWPLPIRSITQYYWSQHRALDISDGKRPQFWASQDGVVELSGWQSAYGRTIVVNHGNGIKTRYAHASELYVNAGETVTKGQVIGRVGNTGRVYGATGNHLHYEVTKNGVKVNPLDYVD